MWDRGSDIDIVERALAILEEEASAWVTRPVKPASATPATSESDELHRDDT